MTKFNILCVTFYWMKKKNYLTKHALQCVWQHAQICVQIKPFFIELCTKALAALDPPLLA